MNIETFLQYIKYEKRYSPNTYIAYQKDLEQFVEFLKANYFSGNFSGKQVSFQMIRSWLSQLVDSGLDTRSVNRKISTLKSFFKFLIKEKEIEINPMQKIVSPRISKKITPYVEEENLIDLLEDEEITKGYFETRNFLILEILYQTGIRLSELIALKHEDIDFHNLTIKVLGKRNKERIIPITKILKDKIIFYLELKEKEEIINLADKNYLFLTKKGEKIYSKFVYRIVFYYLSKITTNKKKSPHVLRHTFATHMLNHGADLNAIKEILGHSNLSATQVYSHNSISKLKSIYKQAHPRA